MATCSTACMPGLDCRNMKEREREREKEREREREAVIANRYMEEESEGLTMEN